MDNEKNVTNETVNEVKVEEQDTVATIEAIAREDAKPLLVWEDFFEKLESAMMNVPDDKDENYKKAKDLVAELLTYAVMRDEELFFINGVPIADCKLNDKLAAMLTVTWRLEFYDRYSGPNFKGDAHLVKLEHEWDDYVRALAYITKRINPKFKINGGGVMFHNNTETITTGTAYMCDKGVIHVGTEVSLVPWVVRKYDHYDGNDVLTMKVYQKKLGQRFVDIVNALPSSQS